MKVKLSPRKQKKKGMILSFAIIYLLLISCLSQKILRLFEGYYSTIQKIFILFIALMICIQIAFGLWNLIIMIFSLKKTTINDPDKNQIDNDLKIEILYCTCNDFNKHAATCALEQDYPNISLIILDDSKLQNYKDEIDAFAASHPNKVRVVRRSGREHAKAGNLNNYIKKCDADWVIIIDADTLLDSDYVIRMLPYTVQSEKIACIQSATMPNPKQPSNFSEDLSMNITTFAGVFLHTMNDFRFMLFAGHGAMLKVSVLQDKEIDGIAPLVSEDIATAMKIRSKGYDTYYAETVNCYDEFPETYEQLRRQQEKYISGFVQLMHRALLPFIRSKTVSWIEKADLLLSYGMNLLPVINMVFILTMVFPAPIILGIPREVKIQFGGFEVYSGTVICFDALVNSVMSQDMTLISLVIMLSPTFALLKYIPAAPQRVIRTFYLSSVPYFSRNILGLVGSIKYLLLEEVQYIPTGDRSYKFSELTPKGLINIFNNSGLKEAYKAFVRFAFNPHSERIFTFELILGVLIIWFSIKTFSFIMIGYGLCFIVSYLIHHIGWKRITRMLSGVPLLYMASVMLIQVM